MSATDKKIIDRLGWLVLGLAVCFVVLAIRVGLIQTVEGDKYKDILSSRTIKTDTIFANRGNVYAASGDLLATTMSKYTVRMDVVSAVKNKKFDEGVNALADSLAVMFGKSSTYYRNYLKTAKRRKNRYLFIARDLGYIDYVRLKSFPVLKHGKYRGGLITEQRNVRARPLGEMGVRTVGYADYRGHVGIEGAFINHLKEHNGWRKKQKIAKGQWKPINDKNEQEPQDGRDVITTIDVNIQDVAHNALLSQLVKFEADHGCAVVMEAETGDVKAIVNLGRSAPGKYFEKRNYAVYEAQEPGSTFKLASLLVALEDEKVDTGKVVDTEKGVIKVYGRSIRDSHRGGYGKVSLARAIEVSSNVGIAKMVMENYKSNPQQFVDGVKDLGFGEKIGIPIKGEGTPFIPDPKYVKKGDPKSWNGLSLPWMAWGYGIKITPLQILTFYNAIGNNGIMVRPKFIKELRNQGIVEETFKTEIIKERIASEENVLKLQAILENVVKRGTGERLYSPNFSMAGKTGTCQAEYWTGNTQYISSFAGFFPAKNPKYSCIVVVNKPNKRKGYYGATVAAPVFKAIAQKIYASNLQEQEVSMEDELSVAVLDKAEEKFYKANTNTELKMPNVRGMALMDAVSVLENKGLRVAIHGKTDWVKRQSILKGTKIRKGQQVVLN
ncbi:penicillin-binding protein [Wenyingzhuangia sp. IMCC45574]